MEIRNHIISIIENKGYITIDEFMELSISSSDTSYYNKINPFDDVTGDFITSPQISQMFGEMMGIWIYNQYLNMELDERISLVELGPGTGLLMRDILRVLSKTNIMSKLQVSMVERSPILRSIQQEELKIYNNISWVEDYRDISDHKSIFISNEFFDVFPIKQFIKLNSKWHEIVIIKNQSNELEFSQIRIEELHEQRLDQKFPQAENMAIVEESPKLNKFMQFIAQNIKEHGSIMLGIDYGYNIDPQQRKANMFNSTLQAVKHHKYINLLQDIGYTDITAHVDFASLAAISRAEGVKPSSIISQNELLHKLGIKERLESLIQVSPEYREILMQQYKRLVSPEEMGLLFKAICFAQKEQPMFIFEDLL